MKQMKSNRIIALIVIDLLVFLFFLVVLQAGKVHANSTIVLENKSRTTIIYMVYWIDHDWKVNGRLLPYPVNVMGGELLAGEKYISMYKYSSGHYLVRWYDTSGEKFIQKFEVPKQDSSVNLIYQ